MNNPSSNYELVKIVFFIFLQLGTCFLLVGILPTIFLLVISWLVIRDRNFVLLDRSVFFIKIYTYIFVGVGIAIQMYISLSDPAAAPIPIPVSIAIGLGIGAIYLLIFSKCFRDPFKKYIDYLVEKDSSEERTVLNTENDVSYSVAGELLKWNELRKQGVISEQEFLEMKEKILSK